MRIFLMGGTGLVGSRLVKRLLERGDAVTVLTRRPDAAREKWGQAVAVVQGDPTQAGAWMESMSNFDAVVNLTGEGIFNRRWSDDFIKLLRDSRVDSTANVAKALAEASKDGARRVLVNASAIGYYGPHGDEEISESDPAGSDTLANICVEWEKATQPAIDARVHVTRVRVGVVLDREGGALTQMMTPFKMFVGGPVGSGKQWISWIHHEDMVGVLLLALDKQDAQGAMNATAPQPATNKEFSKALGAALGRPSFLPTPGFALRVMLGQVAEVVTNGQRVLPKKALALGYTFKFPEVRAALADVCK